MKSELVWMGDGFSGLLGCVGVCMERVRGKRERGREREKKRERERRLQG